MISNLVPPRLQSGVALDDYFCQFVRPLLVPAHLGLIDGFRCCCDAFMRFNGQELGHISAQWNSVFEGILLVKQRPDSFFRRSSSTRSTDLVGVVLLERCSVRLVVDADVRNAFQIEFKFGEPPLLLAARSAEEAKVWCGHIAAAGLTELSARRAQLREELLRITGKDPLDPLTSALPPLPATSDADELNVTGLELQLSLIAEKVSSARGPEPSLRITVAVKDAGEAQTWNVVAETEIETSICPTFLKTIKLSSEKYSKSSHIQFRLLEFKDLRSSVARVVSSAETTVEALSSSTVLDLPMSGVDASNRPTGQRYRLVLQVNQRFSTLPDENVS
uniref:PH domain-containing protein n=1 Tax=Mesocestoides corti TaxID=53468 RepID=A0A5K3G256_MESCO